MANQEHLDILRQGIDVWNMWRKEHSEIQPDLEEAPLSDLDLQQADLSGANLRGVDFSETNLNKANLRHADLSNAIFVNSNLQSTDLRDAYLYFVDFRGALLRDAHLAESCMGWTILAMVDLSVAKGLEAVRHDGPSTLSIDAIVHSKNHIPKVFLRGTGVPDTMIEYLHSLMGKALDFYSCFISHSNKDLGFAERLYADLQSKAVRCWLSSEDLKIGDKLRPRIDESIRIHDKLLLVLSASSVVSQWVEQEVETALDREREECRTVLFPIRIDNAIIEAKGGWPSFIRNTRHIGDFTNWTDRQAYQSAFDRLLRDLKQN